MKIFTFDKEVSSPMARYQSVSVFYSHVAKIATPSSIGFMYIEPKGVVGLHEAPSPQLFLVVHGEGWIRGEEENRIPVKTGEGVFWDKGEVHESGSDSGMRVIIVQCDNFDSNTLTPDSSGVSFCERI